MANEKHGEPYIYIHLGLSVSYNFDFDFNFYNTNISWVKTLPLKKSDCLHSLDEKVVSNLLEKRNRILKGGY